VVGRVMRAREGGKGVVWWVGLGWEEGGANRVEWEAVRCKPVCALGIGAWNEKLGSRLTIMLFLLPLPAPSPPPSPAFPGSSSSPASGSLSPPSANHSSPNSYGFASGLPFTLSMFSCRRGMRAVVGGARPFVYIFGLGYVWPLGWVCVS
jgi:hypothetical protein